MYFVGPPPSKRQKLEPRAEWAELPVLEPSIESDELYFVNREEAITQLIQIYRSTFKRASSGAGLDWMVPLLDNVAGIGKSTFTTHFIRKCKEVLEPKDDFEASLCNSHTVSIVLTPGVLVNDMESCDIALTRTLVETLNSMFKNPPTVLDDYKAPATVVDKIPLPSVYILKRLVAEAGPIFIVLDEIGNAFDKNKSRDSEKREAFLSFCKYIISGWLTIKGVFVILVGRGSFLSYVGTSPVDNSGMVSPVVFKRLPLKMLRKNAIAEVVKKSFKGDVSLMDYYRLQPDEVDSLAETLFRKTNGHPRTLVNVFKDCDSVAQVEEMEEQVLIRSWDTLKSHCITYKAEIKEFMESIEKKKPVDLTREVKTNRTPISFDVIASNALIAWEGTSTSATLHAPSYLASFFLQLVYPFREIVNRIPKYFGGLIDYSAVFELMCITKFQELFGSANRPKNVLLDFFSETQFGEMKFSVPHPADFMPKVTMKGQTAPKLEASTIHPDSLPKLLAAVKSQRSSVSLKPRPKSASPDGIFITKDLESGKTITIGIAIKNFSSTSEFTNQMLLDECSLFNRLFTSTSSDTHNILIVCATKYNRRFEFGSTNRILFDNKMQYPFVHNLESKIPFVDEVILLDLSTKKKRALFFGVDSNDHIMEIVENVVAKEEFKNA